MSAQDTALDSRLAWGIDVLACGYFAWNYLNLAQVTATMAPLIAGLGSTVPAPTAFVLSNHSWLFPIIFGGAALVAVGKEWWVRDKRASACLTFIISVIVLWLSDYLESVLSLPLLDLIRQLQ